jgi:hypothetical protein
MKIKKFEEKRNFDNVQFAEIRKVIDDKYNKIHDELSDCFYNHKPFREYGLLNKEQFDIIHGLIFLKRDNELNKENKTENPEIQQKIDKLKSEGFDLII